MKPYEKIKGKVIVITGGTSGIGKLMVEHYRASGNTVVNLSRSCSGEGDDLVCDVANLEQVESAFEYIKDKYGKVDILINNAGYGISGAVELLDDEQVEKQFAVNFTGVYRCIKCALPLMESGAKIVNISSACALFALPFRSMYCASKSAVNMLTYALREEVRPYKIEVTAICPGDIKTPFTKNRVKNFTTNDRYGERIRLADEHISKREHKRMSPEYAVDKIEKVIAKKHYKPFYIVGGKYKFLYALKRIFPLSVILKATGSMFSPKEK